MARHPISKVCEKFCQVKQMLLLTCAGVVPVGARQKLDAIVNPMLLKLMPLSSVRKPSAGSESLNRISAPISGTSARVMLLRGAAA
jgi:hypothetical protein